jgi:hypothetical protein
VEVTLIEFKLIKQSTRNKETTLDSVQNNSHVYRKCHLRRREGIVACLDWTASQATVEILLAFISLLISASRTLHISMS